jgi:hypothetical protein
VCTHRISSELESYSSEESRMFEFVYQKKNIRISMFILENVYGISVFFNFLPINTSKIPTKHSSKLDVAVVRTILDLGLRMCLCSCRSCLLTIPCLGISSQLTNLNGMFSFHRI